MNEYVWTKGSRVKVNPNVAGAELERLHEQNDGRVTATIVVDAARPGEAPLHPAFEWDDLRAGELYREQQARVMLSSIRIVQPANDSAAERTVVHAYVSLSEDVSGEQQRAYVPMARILANGDLLRQAIARAAAELRSFETRYAEFAVIATAARIAREKIEEQITAA